MSDGQVLQGPVNWESLAPKILPADPKEESIPESERWRAIRLALWQRWTVEDLRAAREAARKEIAAWEEKIILIERLIQERDGAEEREE